MQTTFSDYTHLAVVIKYHIITPNLGGPKQRGEKCGVKPQNCAYGLTCIDDGVGNDVGNCGKIHIVIN